MRGLTIAAALLAVAACTGSAGAQAGDGYAGTWAFQTEPYSAGQGQVGAVMSGVAIISAGAEHRYDIRLLAHEFITSTQNGHSLLLTARENCQGEVQDAQFSITCEMAEPWDPLESTCRHASLSIL